MTIQLSSLTTEEIAQLDTALNVIDAALAMLIDRAIVSEDEGIDLFELGEAVATEIEFRSCEDGTYKVSQALALGEVVEVQRPDGEAGYAPRWGEA